MKRNTNKKIHFYIIFILLSNAIVYLFVSDSTGSSTTTNPQPSIERPGYVTYKLSAQLQTEFYYGKPITIINKQRNIHIPYALLVSITEEPNRPEINADMTISNVNKHSIIVYVHKDYIPNLINSEGLIILPHLDQLSKQQKARTYEVIF